MTRCEFFTEGDRITGFSVSGHSGYAEAGADIVAGLNFIGLPKSNKYNLLVDLGTNAEIALFSEEKVLCTSAAAGPCFEGSNISCGMSASEGAVSAYFADGRVRFHVIQPGIIFDDGVIRVTAIPVEHINHPEKRSYGFSIEAEGKHILYTGDLSHKPDEKDFPQIAYRQHFDLILTECAHFTVERLANCMERVDANYFAVSHVFPLEKIPQIRALAPQHDFELLIPNDGDELLL